MIQAGGAALSEEEGRALSAVLVQQRLSLPTLCELTFSLPPGPLSAGNRLQPGDALEVRVGDASVPLFVGQCTALEYLYSPGGEQAVRVRAYDRLHALRKRQTVRAHVQVTARDLADQLAGTVGLKLEADSNGPLWQRVYQHDQSDLELLVEMAEKAGLYLAVRENTLHLFPLEGVGPEVSLSLGESLLEARLEVNGDQTARDVQATGWDPGQVTVFQGASGAARVGRRVTAAVQPGQVGGDGKRALVDAPVGSTDQAAALAQAALDRAAASEVTLWGVAEGNPRLRPGAPVQVKGVASPFAGRYVLASVTHTIDAQSGFVSEIDTTPPPPAARKQAAVVTLGIVSAIDDPARIGRVRVTLPTYNDIESDWLSVVAPGAGAGKGLMATPGLDDTVLVLFSHEDPGRGLVVGGLFDGNDAPDSGVEGSAVHRFSFRTPGGQLVRLDDENETMHLENSDGSYVTLSPQGVHLHAARDLEIRAPGQAILISGDTIDFRRS
jgi:phage protein D